MESMIVRKGESAGTKAKRLITELIVNTMNWIVPKDAIDNKFDVRIFGGGESGNMSGYTAGGGSGWMNNGEFALTPNEEISIIIGAGGKGAEVAGNTSSFGTYLSANGGARHSGGAGGHSSWTTGTGYQFGGGNGGDGGIWGGGGYGSVWGGRGGLYGGGGGAGGADRNVANYGGGGNGGTYGGGGSGGSRWYGGSFSQYNRSVGGPGIGGLYGGNAGKTMFINGYITPENIPYKIECIGKNGTNTIGKGLEFEGAGLAMMYKTGYPRGDNDYYELLYTGSAGGGYGGNGGSVGGGGYGGNGNFGGGGYGGDSMGMAGGGYGKQAIGYYGGGGYGAPGGNRSGGGGGGYGRGGDGEYVAGFAGGGGASSYMSQGGDGICIIQYYIEVPQTVS